MQIAPTCFTFLTADCVVNEISVVGFFFNVMYIRQEASWEVAMMTILRVLDQNSIPQACYIVKIYHSGPEPSILDQV